MTAPPIRTLAEGRTIAVVGDVYRFLATGDDTNGKYALWEAIVPPGGGPPPHVHSREEEGFYILEGEITFRHAKRQRLLTATEQDLQKLVNEVGRRTKKPLQAAAIGLKAGKIIG